MSAGIERKVNVIEYLSKVDCDRIHRAALQVLEKGGIKFESDAALNLLEEAGCKVDRTTQMAKFPPALVEERIRQCPPAMTIYSRDGRHDMTLGEGRIYFGSSGGMDVIDLETGQRRPGVLRDVSDSTRLADALDNLHNVYPAVSWVNDVPFEANSQAMYVEVLKNTTKSSLAAYLSSAPGEVEDIIKIFQIAAGGAEALRKRPIAISASAPIPPMDNSALNCDAVIQFTEAGFPIAVSSGITGGATGPGTLAGILVQMTAEFLSTVVFVHQISPGHPILYGHYNTIMDMRAGIYASGAIEYAILGAAVAQLARYYHVPSYGFYPMSDAHVMDQQVGYEKSMQWLLSVLGGMELTSSAGAVTDNTLYAHEQMLIDNEMCDMLARALRGIRVEDETLATDVIIRVGPIPGNFLKEKHTTQWYRREFLFPALSEKRSIDAWAKDGSKDIVSKAREKARQILGTHRPAVPAELAQELDGLLESIKKRATVAA